MEIWRYNQIFGSFSSKAFNSMRANFNSEVAFDESMTIGMNFKVKTVSKLIFGKSERRFSGDGILSHESDEHELNCNGNCSSEYATLSKNWANGSKFSVHLARDQQGNVVFTARMTMDGNGSDGAESQGKFKQFRLTGVRKNDIASF